MPDTLFPAARRHTTSLLPGLSCLLRVALFWLALLSVAHAQVAALETLPAEPLGRWMDVLSEKDLPLTLDAARAQLQHGAFTRSAADVPKFGIGARPVWLRLAVNNGGLRLAERLLQIEISWLDKIDVHVVHDGKVIAHRTAGDADALQQHPVAGLGYVFDLALPPGQSDILIRVATPDPMTVPVRLLDPTQLAKLQSQYDFGYGLLYGFLLALIAYNTLLYLGLRERSYLDYTLYLGSFILLNLCYTGHGYIWFWPQQAAFQQYVIPLMMVVFGSLGLRFADGFLDLRRHEPKLHRLVHWLTRSIPVLTVLTILLLRQQDTLLLAFVFILIFSVLMVWLGIVGLRRGKRLVVGIPQFQAAAGDGVGLLHLRPQKRGDDLARQVRGAPGPACPRARRAPGPRRPTDRTGEPARLSRPGRADLEHSPPQSAPARGNDDRYRLLQGDQRHPRPCHG